MSKCTASTREQSAGATRRRFTRSTPAPLQQRMPELFELPFVKIVDDNKEAPRWPEGFDYWAPDAVQSSLDGEFRGHVYALMTAEHLARHCNRGTSILLRIMD